MAGDETTSPTDNEPIRKHEEALGPLSVLLAGLTRTLLYVSRGLPKGVVKAFLRKRAFLTITKRSASAALVDSSKPASRTHGSKVLGKLLASSLPGN